jgi:hypothetical protein
VTDLELAVAVIVPFSVAGPKVEAVRNAGFFHNAVAVHVPEVGQTAEVVYIAQVLIFLRGIELLTGSELLR